MKKIIFSLLFSTLMACNQQAMDPAMMSLLKPCTDMGYPIQQCQASYSQFGHSGDNQWLENVAAFAAGVAANHWWNRYSTPNYAYNPAYWNTNPRPSNITINKTIINNHNAPQKQDSTTSIIKSIPEKNTSTLIPNQKVQPLFTPNKIVPNQTKTVPNQTKTVPNQTPINKPAFTPIQTFKPSVTPNSSSARSTFSPVRTR